MPTVGVSILSKHLNIFPEGLKWTVADYRDVNAYIIDSLLELVDFLHLPAIILNPILV